MRIILSVIVVLFSSNGIAQLADHVKVFEFLSAVDLDSIDRFDEWVQVYKSYPSGEKLDEVRYFVSSGCKTVDKCNIKYQHQTYYEDSVSTLAMKEGKYLVIKNGKAIYHHYGWWYTNKGKVYRRVNEKTTKVL